MDNQTLKSQFFRSLFVHLRELHVVAPFSGVYPFSRAWNCERISLFPEHIRSFFPRFQFPLCW